MDDNTTCVTPDGRTEFAHHAAACGRMETSIRQAEMFINRYGTVDSGTADAVFEDLRRCLANIKSAFARDRSAGSPI